MTSKAPWSVGWRDDDGNRRSKSVGSKSMAEKVRRKIEGEIAAGLARSGLEHVAWEKFRTEYGETILPKWRLHTSRLESEHALKMFEDLVKPKYVDQVTSRTLDQFVAKRLKMPGRKKGDAVSPETIKKELRTIRAALSVAVRWKYLDVAPEMPEVDGYGKDKPFVTEEHFTGIMDHCESAKLPDDQHFEAIDFWRALLAVAFVTGMRKSSLLALRWDDVDFERGSVVSHAYDNKRKKDQRHNIRPAIHLLETSKFKSRWGTTRPRRPTATSTTPNGKKQRRLTCSFPTS